jgi:VIT1/CCC1 family predicted Fe2+/Mn2+ transporter
LNLGKPTKTNHIRITLTGTVQADKSTAQVLYTSWCLATSPLNDGKPHWLQAQTHRFPFEFTLPNDNDTNLPSSLKVTSFFFFFFPAINTILMIVIVPYSLIIVIIVDGGQICDYGCS